MNKRKAVISGEHRGYRNLQTPSINKGGILWKRDTAFEVLPICVHLFLVNHIVEQINRVSYLYESMALTLSTTSAAFSA